MKFAVAMADKEDECDEEEEELQEECAQGADIREDRGTAVAEGGVCPAGDASEGTKDHGAEDEMEI